MSQVETNVALPESAFTVAAPPDARPMTIDELRRISQWLRVIVKAQQRTRFDRAHFKQYGEWALVFEAVYYVLDSDYNLYMDVQQAINLAIYERLEREGVEFAQPARAVRVKAGRALESAEA